MAFNHRFHELRVCWYEDVWSEPLESSANKGKHTACFSDSHLHQRLDRGFNKDAEVFFLHSLEEEWLSFR